MVDMSTSSTPPEQLRCFPAPLRKAATTSALTNNNCYVTDRKQNVFWAGVKYAVTPTFDVIGAYYGVRQGYFTVGGGPAGSTLVTFPGLSGIAGGPGNPLGGRAFASQAAACAAFSASSPGCAGTIDMFSLAIDWRFARHVDLYAGVAYYDQIRRSCQWLHPDRNEPERRCDV